MTKATHQPLAAGLRWVEDGEAGFSRMVHATAQTRAVGKVASAKTTTGKTPAGTKTKSKVPAFSFVYRDAQGRLLRDEADIARIRRLVIPPAWTDVWICKDDRGHLQATGRDARGRKQYRYHADWQAGRGQSKFDHLRDFGKALPGIRRRVQRTLVGGSEPTRERVLATLVRLLDTTFVRIGNREYARDNGSFGLSTLRNRHAVVHGTQVQLSFKGKSGVRHDVKLQDRRVASVLRRCQELPGQELFQFIGDDGSVHRIDSSDVNQWLTQAAGNDETTRITAKDFRTWHGSVQALDLTLAACAVGATPCRPQEVLAQVAKRLGNTPAVCRKAYIHPRVLELSEALVDEAARTGMLDKPWVQRARAQTGLQASERRLLGLLRERARPSKKSQVITVAGLSSAMLDGAAAAARKVTT